MKWMLFGSGMLMSLASVSIAFGSVPQRVTDDTALYQRVSEIRVSRQGKLNFDSDIAQLSRMEGRYKEDLPLSANPKLRGAMTRISQQKYRYSGR